MATAFAGSNPSEYVYIGTYTGPKSEGIYVAPFNPKTGQLGPVELAAKTLSPSFLALHPNGRWLYAVGESAQVGPKKEGSVSAFAIDKKGPGLLLLNQQPSGGSGPCHLSLDASGQNVLVANYSSGSIACLAIDKDGKLEAPWATIQHEGSSVNPKRQSGPHAHYIVTAPEKDQVLACDLGLDKVLAYRFDGKKHRLAPHSTPFARLGSGDGPRHLVFSPNGKWVYVINELSSSVAVFEYDSKAQTLRPVDKLSTLPETFKGDNSCAEIQIHPSGKFLYGSNRGHDSIAIFALDQKTGGIRLIGHQTTQGKTPRHFAIDPSGRWLLAANQDSDSITGFRIDEKTGQLSPTGQSVAVTKPVCLVFHER